MRAVRSSYRSFYLVVDIETGFDEQSENVERAGLGSDDQSVDFAIVQVLRFDIVLGAMKNEQTGQFDVVVLADGEERRRTALRCDIDIGT